MPGEPTRYRASVFPAPGLVHTLAGAAERTSRGHHSWQDSGLELGSLPGLLWVMDCSRSCTLPPGHRRLVNLPQLCPGPPGRGRPALTCEVVLRQPCGPPPVLATRVSVTRLLWGMDSSLGAEEDAASEVKGAAGWGGWWLPWSTPRGHPTGAEIHVEGLCPPCPRA
jgi:hypothetical protein